MMSGMAQKKLNQQSPTPNTQFANTNTNNNQEKHSSQNTKSINDENNYIIRSIWKINENTKTDFYAYLSENEVFQDFDNEDKLLWRINDIKFKDWKAYHEKEFEIELPESVLNNGTYYIHSYFTLSGNSPDPNSPKFNRKKMAYNKKLLTKYKKKKKVIVKKKLFSKEDEQNNKQKEINEKVNLLIIIIIIIISNCKKKFFLIIHI